MHHPMSHPDPSQEFCGTVHGLLGRIPDIIECMQNILDNPVVAIQGKGPLEHDRSFRITGFFLPRAPGSRDRYQRGGAPAARWAVFSGRTPWFQGTAIVTSTHMIDNGARCGWNIYPPHEVHED